MTNARGTTDAFTNPILFSYERASQIYADPRRRNREQIRILTEWQAEGLQLFTCPTSVPSETDFALSSERVGVVGLVADTERRIGFVTRIHAVVCESWYVSPSLPFQKRHLQEILERLIHQCGVHDTLPELWSFQVQGNLASEMRGDSMDVAGLLAMVDAMSGKSNDLLSRSVAVVSPLSGSETMLAASKSIKIKLSGFVREFGRGRLLVKHVNDRESDEFESSFEHVWRVEGLVDLAKKLETAGLLNSFSRMVPLESSHANSIADRMNSMLMDDSKLDNAIDLLRRLENRVTIHTPFRVRLAIKRFNEDAFRHSGDFAEAKRTSMETLDLLKSGTNTSHQEIIECVARYAAALFDAHEFEKAIQMMEPYYERLLQDPMICQAEARIELQNTLARCLVVKKKSNWRELFASSIEIQDEMDRQNTPRTRNYLIHASLKNGDLAEAETQIARQADAKPSSVSMSFLRFYEADFARRKGVLWSEILIAESIAGTGTAHHALGFLHQAVARQEFRPASSRIKHFNAAIESLSIGGGGNGDTSIKTLLILFFKLAIEVLEKDSRKIEDALSKIQKIIDGPHACGLKSFYTRYLDGIAISQDFVSVEELLEATPYL